MDNFISRWKLNHKNFAAIREILQLDNANDEGFFIVGWCELGVISDFVANEIIGIVEKRLDEAETRIKASVVKFILDYCKWFMETDAGGVPIMTPKIYGIDRLYKDGNRVEKSKWLLFYYLFDLDRKQSTLVGGLDEDKRAEF